MQASVTLPLTINSSDTTVIGPGPFVFEELHVHAGKTLIIMPGAELIRQDVPPANPGHADGGIMVDGHLIAVRAPNDPPIIIRSENPTGYRGHLMAMNGGTMELDGVEFRDFGRTKIDPLNTTTNLIARYPVHWHLCGDAGYQSRVENCWIHDTVQPSVWRHGIVVHGTNGLTVRGNTIQNRGGTGIFCEDGTETSNLIENNIVEDIRNYNGLNSATTISPRPVERPTWKNDFGFEGSGIWLRGTRNIVRNNTVRRCAIGFEIFADLSPTEFEPVNEISGNVVEDCYDGFQPWFLGANSDHTNPVICPTRQYVDTFTIRRCRRGVFSYYCGRVSFRDFVIENTGALKQLGWTMEDYRHWECEIIRPTISGYVNGIAVGTYINGGMLIADGNLSGNTNDIVTDTLWHNGDGRYLPPRVVTVRNCNLGSGTKIKRATTTFGQRNFVQLDQLVVEDYQGNAADDFSVYFTDQSPETILPQTTNGGKIVGSPVAGLTNQQNLDQYGVCWAGELLPANATTRTGITGKVA